MESNEMSNRNCQCVQLLWAAVLVASVCTAQPSGIVRTWGDGSRGALGNGGTANSNVPVDGSGLMGVVAVAGRLSGGMALKTDGTVWAWGRGELGDGTLSDSPVPVQISGISGV